MTFTTHRSDSLLSLQKPVFSLPGLLSSMNLMMIIFVGGGFFLLCNLRSIHAESPTNHPFSALRLDQVEVKNEIGRRINITQENNLLALNVDDDFLYPFQHQRNEECFIGLGLLIDSLVRLGIDTKEKQILDLKEYVIHETLRTQDPNGYIGVFLPKRRYKTLWDIAEMSFLVLGLSSDYRYFKQQKSLDAAQHLANYILTQYPIKLKSLTLQNRFTLEMATVGLEESFLQLYEETGCQRYLEFCTDTLPLPEWNAEIVLGRYSPVKGHAFAYLHTCLSQLRLYRLQPNPTLLKTTERLLEFLIAEDGLTIPGVCGQNECWHNNQDGTDGLGETCATAYWIRLLDNWIQITGDLRFGDWMERSIYNGLFAAQSPDGRQIRYFTPFEGKRKYYKYDTYCCPGNYRRIVADLPGMIYYKTNDGLAVNLFTESEATIDFKNGVSLHVEQNTHYPRSGKVMISLNPFKPSVFPVQLRIPRWCKKAEIIVNDDLLTDSWPGGTAFTHERQWNPGDCIELHFPMKWRLIKGRKAQAGRVAVMRGPILFGLNRTFNPKIAQTDLRTLTIDPNSIRGPLLAKMFGPSCLVCMVKGWKTIGFTTGEYPDSYLYLTEYPDPDIEMIYFNVRQMESVGEDDELNQLPKKASFAMP